MKNPFANPSSFAELAVGYWRVVAVALVAAPIAAPMVLLVALPSSGAFAGSPTVEQFQPGGMQRGTEAEFAISGDGLADATGITSDDSRISCTAIEPENNKKATLKLKVAEDTPPGLYPIWVVTKTGLSNPRLLSVGTMPTVAEIEPNSNFDAAQPIDMNCTVNGVIEREDLDFFKIDLQAEQTIHLEIEGLRLQYTLNNQNIFDPYIAVLDEGRFEVAASDDASMWQQDGFCSYTADQDATYTILVRDSSFGGSGVANYRLHIGDFPRPLALLPGGGRPGTSLDGHWIRADGSSTEVSIDLPAEPADRYPVWDRNEHGISPSPIFVRVVDLAVAPEIEPNGGFDAATAVPLPVAISGVIDPSSSDSADQPGASNGADDPDDKQASAGKPPEDLDFFSFECQEKTKYLVQVYARETLRSRLDATVNVYGSDRKRLAGNDDNGGAPDPYLEFTAAANGTHYLRIDDHLGRGSPLHHYRIEITVAAPTVTLSPKELRRDETYYPVVPAGGNGVMVVSAKRQDYGGEIIFGAESLPAGVTATAYRIPDGRGEIPVVFAAAADAAGGVFPLRLVSTADGYQTRFEQSAKLVLGQNRRSLWSIQHDQTQLVVAERSPFSIEVVAPTTAIVREGSKDLTVRISRDEGFNNTVSLRGSYNPPGIGINNGKRFEKETTELTIPLTANGAAAEGDWPLVFVVRYGDGTGAHEIATAAVMLTVEKQYFKFEFPAATAEMGTESQIEIKTEVLRDLPADAEVEIVGLPNGVSSPAAVQPITRETSSIVFPITIAADAKPGTHKTINVIGRIKLGDEPIVQTGGTGSIRVDEPLPVKAPAEPDPQADAGVLASEPVAEPAAEPAAAPKPLSRLEQLRQKLQEN